MILKIVYSSIVNYSLSNDTYNVVFRYSFSYSKKFHIFEKDSNDFRGFMWYQLLMYTLHRHRFFDEPLPD